MATFNYHSSEILLDPNKVLNMFSIDVLIKRDKIIEKMLNKKVYVKNNNEVKECVFLGADMTHFKYRYLDENKIRKTALKNIILRTN